MSDVIAREGAAQQTNETYRFWHSATLGLLGTLGLALLTFVSYRLQLNLATIVLLYLIVVVLVSLRGNFASSAFVSVVAVVCLQYFFVPPIFSLRVTDPLDLVASIVFLTTALVITRLMSKARRSEAYLAQAQRLTRVGSWAWDPSESHNYYSREVFNIFGLDTTKGTPTLAHFVRIYHPEDRAFVEEAEKQLVSEGKAYDIKYRIVRPHGELRWIREVGTPVYEQEVVTRYIGACLDVTEQEQLTQELRESEEKFRKLVDMIPAAVYTCDLSGRLTYYNRRAVESWRREPIFGDTERFCGSFRLYGLDGVLIPHDQSLMAEAIRTGQRPPQNKEVIIERCDQSRITVMINIAPMKNEKGEVIGAINCFQDVTERKRAEEALRQQANLLEQTRDAILVWEFPRTIIFWNRGAEQLYGFSREEAIGRSSHELLHTEHPLPTSVFESTLEREGVWTGELTHTTRDGRKILVESRHVLMREAEGRGLVLETNNDITERKRAEEVLQEQARLLDLTHDTVFVRDMDDVITYWNRGAQELYGWTREEAVGKVSHRLMQTIFPESLEEINAKLLHTGRWDGELVHTKRDGTQVVVASRWSLQRDKQGQPAATLETNNDITERKRTEATLAQAFQEIQVLKDQLYKENLALKEEIDRSSMFEEIVGASPALQAVLARVTKVAPTGSTVLITGETGTGKELIARAIHKRSQRAARAFVSVNCAVVPQSLIASELFGHEKGAFTGALQRHLGRFELAEGGTIFLDEIGELPAETQIALLRVLQEHEFERVGGSHTIRADVRVIAATNRDLKAAIAAGAFRSDLFYRLNVFPIEMPPLRARQEDIPVLVEYFIDRYASKAGKKIRSIEKQTLDLLQSYPWPGNIRELQNVIERSVIICDTENFSVDESWLSRECLPTEPASQPLSQELATHEKDRIETALAATGGRVSGPSGAAAKLGLPPSTLESKIRSLKINKHHFKTS